VNRDSAAPYDAFAVVAPGLEQLVAGELEALGIKDPPAVDGGVEFSATTRQLYEANLHLRAASRVLVRLAKFRAMSFAELEKRARRIPWERVLTRGERVTLRVTCRKSRLYHSDAVAERVKRDLVERLDAEVGASRGDSDDPDTADEGQLIIVRFDHDHCTVSADSSGAHLHQRGYRTSVTEAPMRETLAAALILASGWDRTSPFLDPFCGSGTIPIEAAMIAAGIAPGRNRRFRFMQWPGYDAGLWRRILTSATERETLAAVPIIHGSDRSAAAIRAATENAQRSGIGSAVQFERLDALRADPPSPSGWLVTNPPYGVRLGDEGETKALMAQFARALAHRFGGWRLALLAPARFEPLGGIQLHAGPRTTNGGLRVQILTGVVPDQVRQTDN
jgi:putative N6-adenine-specific DNA methylase